MARALRCVRRHELGSREPGRAHRRRPAQGPETSVQPRGLCNDASAETPKPLCQIALLRGKGAMAALKGVEPGKDGICRISHFEILSALDAYHFMEGSA